VTEKDMASWSPLWVAANKKFEMELQKEDAWKQFSGKMFLV